MLAALIAAQVASGAKRKQLKLTAIAIGTKRVVTPTGGPTTGTLYAVKQGSKKVGTLAVAVGSCTNNACTDQGTANLKVGRVTGKAKLQTDYQTTGACRRGLAEDERLEGHDRPELLSDGVDWPVDRVSRSSC